MTLRCKNLLFFFIIAILVPCFPAVLYADNIPDMLMEGRPAFTLEEAQIYTRDIVPLVEKTAGRKFIKIPEVVVTDRNQMTAVLKIELAPQFANIYPNASTDQLEQLSENQARLLSMCLMGKYGLQDHQLYLLPKNLPPLLKLAKVDQKNSKSLLKLLIAHELTHALQDQYIDLQRVNKITSLDELNAFSATVEGQAVWIQEMVGKQLGLNDSVIELSRMMSAGNIKLDDPALDLINKVFATQYEQIYLGGSKFINYYYLQGGNERVWEILAKPPLKTSMIIKPETYSAIPQEELDYTVLFEGLEEELNSRDWQVQNLTLGQIQIQSVYAPMDESERNEILAQIQHVQTFIAQDTSIESMVSVSAIVINDPKFAPRYLKLLEEMVKKNVKLLESSSSMHINEFEISNFTAFQADIAHKVTFTINVKGDLAKQVFVRICKENLLLEFVLVNYDLNDEQIAQIAGEIFARYQRLIKKTELKV